MERVPKVCIYPMDLVRRESRSQRFDHLRGKAIYQASVTPDQGPEKATMELGLA